MLVCFPFSHRDAEGALALAKWARDLTPAHTGHEVLIIAAATVTDPQFRGVAKALHDARFDQVAAIRLNSETDTGWPEGPNAMFRTAADHVRINLRKPFLWLEPDAIPLKPGWLDVIAEEYLVGNRPFMGTIYPTPRSHMTGVAVYPPNVAQWNPFMLAKSKLPFDTIRPERTLRHLHVTDLIHHEWGDVKTNTPWSFPDAKSLTKIRPEAVIFHRCKSGDLISRLRELNRRVPAKDLKQCVICLGRYGDIMNALPIARDLASKDGRPVAFVVAEAFADILDGVNYAQKIIFDGRYSDMPGATALAKRQFKRVVRAQIFGTKEADYASKVPYNRMAWKLAGYSRKWTRPDIELVFDNRSPRRERALINSLVAADSRPLLLLNLTSGHSGPLSDGGLLQQKIFSEFSESFQILDLAPVKAERIYDLLGLMELAAAMVTVDTATVHLAAACPRLPVLLLRIDNAYLGTEPRCNCPLQVKYSRWKERYPEISQWLTGHLAPPSIIHTFERHSPLNPRSVRAQSSWQPLWSGFGWEPAPFSEPYPRSSREIGDPRGVPYINDVLAHVLGFAKKDSVIVYTNDDIILLPEIHSDILKGLSRAPAICSSRRDIADFSQVKRQPESPNHIHVGRDLFAFRAWWLRKMLPEIPPLLLGSQDWDNVFVNLMRRETGTLLTGDWTWEYGDTITDCEMASPNVLHEAHEPFYNAPENKYGPPNLWNRIELAKWQKRYLPDVKFIWADQTLAQLKEGKIVFTPCQPKKQTP